MPLVQKSLFLQSTRYYLDLQWPDGHQLKVVDTAKSSSVTNNSITNEPDFVI